MTALPILQTLAEECWYMFLRYNHAYFERHYVMHLVIHYQFVMGEARALCGLLTGGNPATTTTISETLQQRLNFYQKLAEHNQQELCHLPYMNALMRVTNDLHSATHDHEALVRTLQEASRIEFIPGTPIEELIHKTMLETTTTTTTT